MSEKSNAVYNKGSTSFLISSLGVFSNITCKFSNSITCTGTCFGPLNILLKIIGKLKKKKQKKYM